MNYYKGIIRCIDEPKNGGSYVKETLDAHEKYNFMTADIRTGITALDLWRQRQLLQEKETSLISKRLKTA